MQPLKKEKTKQNKTKTSYRCPTVCVLGVDIGATIEQKTRDATETECGCAMQRAVLERVLCARVRLVRQQQLHGARVLFVDSPMQRRLAIGVARIDASAHL